MLNEDDGYYYNDCGGVLSPIYQKIGDIYCPIKSIVNDNKYDNMKRMHDIYAPCIDAALNRPDDIRNMNYDNIHDKMRIAMESIAIGDDGNKIINNITVEFNNELIIKRQAIVRDENGEIIHKSKYNYNIADFMRRYVKYIDIRTQTVGWSVGTLNTEIH